MNATLPPEYRDLALDSSNEMMAYDSRWVLGRYAEAAWHMLQAGLARERMGQITFDAGNFAQAAADWLSAAACFLLATDPKRMHETLARVQQLDQEGKIPPERRDIHTALIERKSEPQTLANKLSAFDWEYRQRVGPTGTARQETLDWLLRLVRELPGSPHLHARLSGQAHALGQRDLAVQSLDWALRFDPNSPHLMSLQATRLFLLGEADKAAEIARAVLAEYPQMDTTRFLLAQSLAFRAGSDPSKWNTTDWEEAIAVLEPLLQADAPNTLEKVMAVGLLVTVSHGVGNETEYRRALAAFNKLAESPSEPLANKCVIQLRQAMPHVFPQPGSNGKHTLGKPDYAAVRSLFGQPNPLPVGA
jgi:tetratricopeptide (TPR) repeat protein